MTTTPAVLKWVGPPGQTSQYLGVQLEPDREYTIPDVKVARAMLRAPDCWAVVTLPDDDETPVEPGEE